MAKVRKQGTFALPAATLIDTDITIENAKALLTIFGKQGHFFISSTEHSLSFRTNTGAVRNVSAS